MHHPGPPRFVATGEEVELAPRDPDPAATYSWTLVQRPDASSATLSDDPVEHFVPDAPGRYVARLTAPDGTHAQTIRVVPGSLSPGSVGGASGTSGGPRRSGGDRLRERDDTLNEDASAGDDGDEYTVDGDDADETGDGDETEDDGGGRPRVTLSAAVEGDEVVVCADPKPNPRGSERASDLDVAFELDDRDPVTRADVAVGDRELAIPLSVFTGRVRVYAVALGAFGYSVPDAIELEPGTNDALADGGSGVSAESGVAAATRTLDVSHPYHPPDWAEDAIIYEVYVRTFGGDDVGDGEYLDAIRERLDYIESLGVDTLWLTPVLENDHAPHGYNVTDFFAIAEDLGTRSDYERLIDAAHDRGIRVLFDLVCNHSARAHPHFQAAVSDPGSEYRDWYEWRSATEPETYFDWEYIANFDFDHLPVRRHLLDAIDQWAPLVDGFRCDMAWAVPNGFWREVHDRLKERDPSFLLLDETIPYIPDFQAGLFDEHFDSTTYAALRGVGRGEVPADAVLDAVAERTEAGFPDYAGFMLYAENHDEARYLAECGRPAARAALGALFTLPGSPMVYAGQEFAQLGKRDALVWDRADDALTEFVRSLATARREEPALAADAELVRVDYEVASGDGERVVVYGRDPPGGEPVVVALHFGEGTATVRCDAVGTPTDAVSGDAMTIERGVAVDDVCVFPAAGFDR